jgi:hypothetical protein
MTTPHKATPEQWAELEEWATKYEWSSCVVELRDRLAAAEQRIQELERRPIPGTVKLAAQPTPKAAPVATDEELASAMWTRSGRRAVYDLGREHGAAQSTPPTAPAVIRKPLRCPSPAWIAECGGPCEQGFHLCDCGVLERMNPELRGPAPAGGLVERVTKAVNKTTICERDGIASAAILAVAEWLDDIAGITASWLREEVQHHG